MTNQPVLTAENIAKRILILRGRRVILDADLAEVYGMKLRFFNGAVRRNLNRFPPEFMFQLTPDEFAALTVQKETPRDWRGRRYLPYVFTEYGVVTAATILKSELAVSAGISIASAFVHLQEILATNGNPTDKLSVVAPGLAAYDGRVSILTELIHQLSLPVDAF